MSVGVLPVAAMVCVQPCRPSGSTCLHASENGAIKSSHSLSRTRVLGIPGFCTPFTGSLFDIDGGLGTKYISTKTFLDNTTKQSVFLPSLTECLFVQDKDGG